MAESIEISIDQQHKRFKHHIEDDTNKRILFSGPFGSGKTYFLKKFFSKEDVYTPFFIYPVNYSVSQNEDIFELLKFDIFFELLRLGVTLPKEEEKLPWIYRQYNFLNKSSELIIDVVKNSTKIGKNVTSIAEKLVELEETFNRKNSSEKNERDELIQFLKAAAKEKGSVHEEDNNTLLIRTLLDQLKENKEKPVLIIDDLDRIDPDHIFRLFNVFASHLDRNEKDNKFGFEKIIFVCDFNNIRNLFRAKFGPLVDFNGYMAKFYNADVYDFNNKAPVEKKIEDLLNCVSLTEERFLKVFNIHSPYSTIRTTILYILTGLVKCEAVNLRNVIKMNRHAYHFEYYDLYPNTGMSFHNTDLPILIILDFIKWIVGGGASLVDAIKKASESLVYQTIQDSADSENREKLSSCVTILALDDIYQAHRHEQNNTYHFTCCKIKLAYQIQRFGDRMDGVEASIQKNDQLHKINYFQALLETVKRLQEYQLLK